MRSILIRKAEHASSNYGEAGAVDAHIEVALGAESTSSLKKSVRANLTAADQKEIETLSSSAFDTVAQMTVASKNYDCIRKGRTHRRCKYRSSSPVFSRLEKGDIMIRESCVALYWLPSAKRRRPGGRRVMAKGQTEVFNLRGAGALARAFLSYRSEANTNAAITRFRNKPRLLDDCPSEPAATPEYLPELHHCSRQY